MVKLINFAEFLEKKKGQNRVDGIKMLKDTSTKIEDPNLIESYSWVVNRISAGQCELLCPDTFQNYPFDKNNFLPEWMKRLGDERFICAFFRNPRVKCDLFYARSLRPSETNGIKEEAYMAEPNDVLRVFKAIDETYGITRISHLSKNAVTLSSSH